MEKQGPMAGNFVLVVEFTLQPDAFERFAPLIAENARKSVALEPGCLQFDVARALEAPDRILLYEVYADEAAFNAHSKMPHVAEFFSAAGDMIAERKVTRLERLRA